MIDLPFPSIIQGETREQIEDIHQYLLRLREELEYIISNLSTENFSTDLNSQFETIVQLVNAAVEDAESARISAANGLTIHDVVGSALFKQSMEEQKTYTDEKAQEAKTYADGVLKYTDVVIGSVTIDSTKKASISSFKPTITGTLLFAHPLTYSGGNGAITIDADGNYLHANASVSDLTVRYFYK